MTIRTSLVTWWIAFAAACGGSSSQPTLDARPESDAAPDPDAPPGGDKRIVILMIGDGLGRGQLDAASHFKRGDVGQLFLQSLPVRGTVITSGPSGITDSAAASTTMATGARAYNGAIGLDRAGNVAETAVELAHRHGLKAGLVSTAALPHATPAAFSAHRNTRHDMVQIADDQAITVKPDVMLGGGARYFLPSGPDSARTDDGLLDELASADYVVARTKAELAAAAPGKPLIGLFAPEHLAYTTERAPETTEPTLAEMSLAAIQRLDAAPDGFFLMIEGARIDMASHGNRLAETIAETVAFDEAVEAVATWAATRADVTLIVTADQECGGLEVLSGGGVGALPEVRWGRDHHTNAPVDVYARGPGATAFENKTIDHRWIHGVIAARLSGGAFAMPAAEVIPDGRLTDLAHVAATQGVTSGFGVGFNQLDELRLAADEHGLSIGIAGVFERGHNAVVVLVDVDFGASTGVARLSGAITDSNGRLDAILASSWMDAPEVAGWGADLALVAWGAEDPSLEQIVDGAGIRGLRPPYGQASDLGWYSMATNFGEGTKSSPPTAATPMPGMGWEVFVPWDRLYPSGRPPGATLAVAAILVNDDGGYTSNQALPSFPANTENPGNTLTRFPGVVSFTVDGNNDGVVDPITSSTILP